MNDDNVIPFPGRLKDEVNEKQWKALQAEFYLDCYFAAKGYPANDPDELQNWLLHARIKADIENPFFRGWLVRRLSEENTVPVDA
jgi:hypothetical protein